MVIIVWLQVMITVGEGRKKGETEKKHSWPNFTLSSSLATFQWNNGRSRARPLILPFLLSVTMTKWSENATKQRSWDKLKENPLDPDKRGHHWFKKDKSEEQTIFLCTMLIPNLNLHSVLVRKSGYKSLRRVHLVQMSAGLASFRYFSRPLCCNMS